MFRRENQNRRSKKVPLPPELWLLILDIAVEEGIVQLDHCDYTTFPHISSSFLASAPHNESYDSYRRLRLVCWMFNTLLGARPWHPFSDSTSPPWSIPTRVLSFNLGVLSKPHLRRLLAEMSTCSRLVFLDVTSDLSMNLSDVSRAGRASPNVRRLTLRLINRKYSRPRVSLWTPLRRAFPSLVTLTVVTAVISWVTIELEAGDDIVCFDRLEILCFHGNITYQGCHFPRLRHASVWLNRRRGLEILTRSPHLESLLIRSDLSDSRIDVTSCLRLKVLGFPDNLSLVQLGRDHPLEHIWLYSAAVQRNPYLFEQLSRWVPKVSRITVEYPSSVFERHRQRINKVKDMRLGSFGLSTKPFTHDDHFLVLEREGVLRRIWSIIWSKMRW